VTTEASEIPDPPAPRRGRGRPPKVREGTGPDATALPPPPAPKEPVRSAPSALVLGLADRAVRAREDDVRAFVPDDLDVQMVQAMLLGCVSGKAVAESVEVSAPTVSKRLRDPVRAAWISRELTHAVRQTIGLVHASMLARALGGNVPAARLLMERFDKLAATHLHLHAHQPGAIDVTKLSDADLERLVEAESRT